MVRLAPRWPRPIVNQPLKISNLDRDKLYRLLNGINGIDIPATVAVSRGQLEDVAQSRLPLETWHGAPDFPSSSVRAAPTPAAVSPG